MTTSRWEEYWQLHLGGMTPQEISQLHNVRLYSVKRALRELAQQKGVEINVKPQALPAEVVLTARELITKALAERDSHD